MSETRLTIDILINKWIRNFITREAAFLGAADIHADHNPLIANIVLRLGRWKQVANMKRIDTRKLTTNENI